MFKQVEISKVIKKLSPERFEAYRKPGESDKEVLARICWNTALSEALFPCLHGLEVGFRNSLHQAVPDTLAAEIGFCGMTRSNPKKRRCTLRPYRR
jgi:hypothetical protein